MLRYLILLLLSLLLTSCGDTSDSDLKSGDQFTGSKIRVVKIDTATIKMSTMKFDSIVTSNTKRILIGSYIDPDFGRIKAASYFELLPSSLSIDNEAVYDSIFMVLKYDHYYYNDTLTTNTLIVKRLNDEIRPETGNEFYNTSSISAENEALGSITYQPRPASTDSLEIRLSDAFGLDIFTQLQKKYIVNTDQLKEYFKGIVIEPGAEDDGAVIGFSNTAANSYMRMYFSTKDDNGSNTVGYKDFTMNTGAAPATFFNHISADLEGTPFESLTNREEELSSEEGGDKTYFMSGIAMSTKLTFPYIKRLYELDGTGTILAAKLKLYPVKEPSEALSVKDSLQVYILDKNNYITQQAVAGVSDPVFAYLNREQEEYGVIYYELTLGTYIEDLLLAKTNDETGLVFLPTDFAFAVNRAVIHAEKTGEYKPVLEITYAIYDED